MSSQYKPGETYKHTFFTYSPTAAGVTIDADSTPVVEFLVDGVEDAAVVTVTQPNTNTGEYLASGTIPGAAGDKIDVRATVVIDGDTYIGKIDSFRLVGMTMDDLGAPTPPLDSGTAQAGGADTITLRAGAPSSLDTKCSITITGGTGVGQTGWVESYNGTTKEATMTEGWLDVPDDTSEYAVYRISGSDVAANQAAVIGGILETPGQKIATDVSGNVNALVADKTGFKLAADGEDAITVDGLTGRQWRSICLAALAGQISGANPGSASSVIIKTPGGGATRITATCDNKGNRTSITLSPA
jgi:hypothetical protein